MSKTKKHSSFIKICIKTDNFKLNLIPIPFFLAKFAISLGCIGYKKTLKADPKLTEEDINNDIQIIKSLTKELKKFPPFEIVNLESGNTKIIIKTK